jgi:murein DD-endopeptidase MepM/ murein hydrolase activator NlpD
MKLLAITGLVILGISFLSADDASKSKNPSLAIGKALLSKPELPRTTKAEPVKFEPPLPEVPIQNDRVPMADGFDFPVGAPDGEGYHLDRQFIAGAQPGERWNGNGGGDSDLGDPVFSIGAGLVIFANDAKRGWGNVVIIRHKYIDTDGTPRMVDSLYGMLNEIKVREGELVERGFQIGTIGQGPHQMYSAHLYIEIRKNIEILMNRPAFAKTLENYHVPSRFIETFRKRR